MKTKSGLNSTTYLSFTLPFYVSKTSATFFNNSLPEGNHLSDYDTTISLCLSVTKTEKRLSSFDGNHKSLAHSFCVLCSLLLWLNKLEGKTMRGSTSLWESKDWGLKSSHKYKENRSWNTSLANIASNCGMTGTFNIPMSYATLVSHVFLPISLCKTNDVCVSLFSQNVFSPWKVSHGLPS